MPLSSNDSQRWHTHQFFLCQRPLISLVHAGAIHCHFISQFLIDQPLLVLEIAPCARSSVCKCAHPLFCSTSLIFLEVFYQWLGSLHLFFQKLIGFKSYPHPGFLDILELCLFRVDLWGCLSSPGFLNCLFLACFCYYIPTVISLMLFSAMDTFCRCFFSFLVIHWVLQRSIFGYVHRLGTICTEELTLNL